ncbi:MAG: hypothetical protein AAB317_01640 [Nitrospirota bacterium]
MDHMIRPKMNVLSESAVVPDRNLIRPTPTQFTHEVKSEQPYYYNVPGHTLVSDGTFLAGTKVVLLSHDGGSFCHVVDGHGLSVVTAFEGLRPIGNDNLKRPF